MSSSYRVTIKDVAKKAGVCIATVSRFFNHPSSLKKTTQKRLERVIKELNYQPLTYARRLAGGQLNTFGLIIPGYEGIFSSFYALEIIRQIASVLDRKGIDLHLHIFWGKDNFNSSLVDGVIFADVINNTSQLERLVRENLPTVVINKKIDNLTVSYVSVDNFKGAYEAVEFLIQHGHKRIAHLGGDLSVQCAQERLNGYRSALEKYGIEVRQNYIKITGFSPYNARKGLKELFSLKKAPTAIFCCSDEVAKEVLIFAQESNISIPEELSVIGFDDSYHCAYKDFMLTTVRQPFSELCLQGVEILSNIIEKKSSLQKVTLQPELVVRDTVSFCREAKETLKELGDKTTLT